MRIAVLAWGSIIWDRQKLKVIGDFEPIGPRLPLEFCRISRNGRLTLAIDEMFGAQCVTHSAISAFNKLDHAIQNLREREDMPNPRASDFRSLEMISGSAIALERQPSSVKTITEWMATTGFDATIWTALATNFAGKTKKRFSVEAAIRYLEGLHRHARDEALTYIRNAPPQIQTPVREAINLRWRERP